MRRNFNKEFLAALNQELKACGLPENEESRQVFHALARGRAPRWMAENEAIAFGFLTGLADDFRRGAKKRWRIRNEKDLNRALEQIHNLRYKLRPALAEALSKVVDMLPRKPRGPEPKLTRVQKVAACSTIDTLVRNGSTVRYAIGITARDYKITPRLMRKIWEQKGRAR